MNRLIVSFAPVLGLVQSDDADGVMLLQKNAMKTQLNQPGMPGMLTEIPADRIPPVANYNQADKTGFKSPPGGGDCGLAQERLVGQPAFTACASQCDSDPNCGGFMMGNMQLFAPVGAPIAFDCTFGCMDGEPIQWPEMYSYWKTERTTTQATTTTTTASTLYIYKPSCGCDGGWTEECVKWCCENKETFPGKDQFCPNAVVPGAVDDPHITSVKGAKFDVYKPGDHEFLVLPEGATPENADLHISGKVKKFGERDNDLWIRKLKVQGKWVQDGPYQFKTSNAPFGKTKSALIRVGALKAWTAMDKANLNSNLRVVSSVDNEAPKADFAQSVSKMLELQAGPIKVLVDFATSQKNGEDINHLDLHLQGLEQNQAKSMGGLLAGDVSALQLKK